MSLMSNLGGDAAQYVACTELGRGASATVFLVHERRKDQLLAVKCRQRSKLSDLEEERSIRHEQELFLRLNQTGNPFFPRLWDSLKTTDSTYLVMDFFSAGDLEVQLQQQPFTPCQTRFYATELCLAIKHLHDNGILHRNINLDNILLAPDGHIKLSGFGIHKPGMTSTSRTSTFCGSAPNAPPEMLLNQPYGMAVDWWLYGVTVYQMITREVPFQGDTEDDIYDAILSGLDPHLDSSLPSSHRDILCGLLQRDPNQRLGGSVHDSLEIMRHEYFHGVDWDNVLGKNEVPFIPAGEYSRNHKNLCLHTADRSVDPHYHSHKELSAEMQRLFDDFSQSLSILE